MTHEVVRSGSSVSAAEDLVRILPRIMRHVFSVDGDALAELPLSQIRVCNALLDGPRTMSSLSREFNVTLSAMTQTADRLERSGYVRRVAEDGDRRVRCLQLTEHGESMMRQNDELRMRRAEELLLRLNPELRSGVISAFKLLAREAVKMWNENSHSASARQMRWDETYLGGREVTPK